MSEQTTDAERIAALTRGYIALANFRFNKFKSSEALFSLVMETKGPADDAVDRDERDAMLERIGTMPVPTSVYDLDER